MAAEDGRNEERGRGVVCGEGRFAVLLPADGDCLLRGVVPAVFGGAGGVYPSVSSPLALSFLLQEVSLWGLL